jgi:hypothetical protein
MLTAASHPSDGVRSGAKPVPVRAFSRREFHPAALGRRHQITRARHEVEGRPRGRQPLFAAGERTRPLGTCGRRLSPDSRSRNFTERNPAHRGGGDP